MHEIPVIFRADNEDGTLWITAVFPTLLGTDNPGTFTTYQHVGQHGIGTYAWYSKTRAAKPEEYRELYEELKGIYAPDTLVIKRRMTPQHRAMRMAESRVE